MGFAQGLELTDEERNLLSVRLGEAFGCLKALMGFLPLCFSLFLFLGSNHWWVKTSVNGIHSQLLCPPMSCFRPSFLFLLRTVVIIVDPSWRCPWALMLPVCSFLGGQLASPRSPTRMSLEPAVLLGQTPEPRLYIDCDWPSNLVLHFAQQERIAASVFSRVITVVPATIGCQQGVFSAARRGRMWQRALGPRRIT